mgnify:FL=1
MFQERGGPWPPHCLQDSDAASFHPDLKLPESVIKVTKGVRLDEDQNSAFDKTGLGFSLRRHGVKRLLVGGLAEDVCVKETVLDGLKEGIEVLLISKGTRPVSPEGGQKARQKMQEAGAKLI